MKHILIVGSSSYIGNCLTAWLTRTPNAYALQTLSLRDPSWRAFDMSGFDSVVLVAGIAHQQETAGNLAQYDAVNHLLAVEVAQKAKQDGVPQFVFFSSMSVYGLVQGSITPSTPLAPNTAYGKSKLAAEQDIAALSDDHFQVATLRPPMIYGKGCKGNYPRLSELIQKLPLFPRVSNARSMLYIDVLCMFMDSLLTSGQGGLYFPQNRDYVSTDVLARQIALVHGKRLWQPRGFAWLIHLLSKRIGPLAKLFGSLTYEQSMSSTFMPAVQPSFAESIWVTEGMQP